MSRNFRDNQCQGRKLSAVIDKLLEASRKQELYIPGNSVIGEPPHFCKIYMRELDQLLTIIFRKKFLCFQQEKEEGTILKYTRALSF